MSTMTPHRAAANAATRHVSGQQAFLPRGGVYAVARAIPPQITDRHRTLRGLLVLAVLALLAGFATPVTAHETATTGDVPANLMPPAEAVLLFELGAEGVQIYACEAKPDDATSFVWTFKAPEAVLYNARGDVVGHHFGGPTWQGNDGSAVIGEVLERADAPEAGAIPWLLLGAKEHTGSGAFSTISYIQRLNTVGGVAPEGGCDADHAGDEARQPYKAVYAFYYAAVRNAATPEA